MAFVHHVKIPATYIRGGTSKGVFFNLTDLPERCQVPGEARDNMLLRVIGSPDPYGKQTDGMGGATSSTSKAVLLSKSTQLEHDVDYLFGQVSIDKAFVDWSGNCGNLTAAVGSFAISNGLVDASLIPDNGLAIVRIWQANIQKTIIAHVPMTNGEVQETGEYELDGVTFPAAEVKIEGTKPRHKEVSTVELRASAKADFWVLSRVDISAWIENAAAASMANVTGGSADSEVSVVVSKL